MGRETVTSKIWEKTRDKSRRVEIVREMGECTHTKMEEKKEGYK